MSLPASPWTRSDPIPLGPHSRGFSLTPLSRSFQRITIVVVCKIDICNIIYSITFLPTHTPRERHRITIPFSCDLSTAHCVRLIDALRERRLEVSYEMYPSQFFSCEIYPPQPLSVGDLCRGGGQHCVGGDHHHRRSPQTNVGVSQKLRDLLLGGFSRNLVPWPVVARSR